MIAFLICLSKLNHVVVPSEQPGKYRKSTGQLITRSLLPIGLLDLTYRRVRLINLHILVLDLAGRSRATEIRKRRMSKRKAGQIHDLDVARLLQQLKVSRPFLDT